MNESVNQSSGKFIKKIINSTTQQLLNNQQQQQQRNKSKTGQISWIRSHINKFYYLNADKWDRTKGVDQITDCIMEICSFGKENFQPQQSTNKRFLFIHKNGKMNLPLSLYWILRWLVNREWTMRRVCNGFFRVDMLPYNTLIHSFIRIWSKPRQSKNQ